MRQGATITRTLDITMFKGFIISRDKVTSTPKCEEVNGMLPGRLTLEQAEKVARKYEPNFTISDVNHERHRYTMSTLDFISNATITDKENDNE